MQVFKKRKLSVPMVIALITISSLLASVLQRIFLSSFADADLGGAYQSYASESLEGGGFFDNAWKIAMEQMALGVLMFFNIKI